MTLRLLVLQTSLNLGCESFHRVAQSFPQERDCFFKLYVLRDPSHAISEARKKHKSSLHKQ